MRMDFDHIYDAVVESVYALITDPAFIKRKYAELGGTNVAVDKSETDSGGCEVVTKRTVTVDLPGFAKRVMKPTNTLIQTEVWEPAGPDGSRVCRYRVEVQGIPSRIDGTDTLSASSDGGGTSQEIVAEVKISIPLVGGRLEKFAAETGRKDLAKEAAATDAALAG